MASSLKYAFYPTWYYVTFPTVWARYRVPILGCTYMYNQCPAAGDPDVIYREGAEAGYNTVASFYKEVCDVLQFNPFTVTTFYMTNDACEDEEIVNVINSFTGSFEAREGTYNGYNPEPDGHGSLAEDLIGYCDLTTGVRGTNAFTGAYFNGSDNLMSRILHYTQYTADDGVEIDFTVWPTEAIEDGFINLDRLFKEDNKYRTLYVKLFIYKKDDKYYWYIKLHANVYTEAASTWLYNKFNGFDLDHVYEPDNPYDDHQKDGNEGGDGGFDNDSDPTPIPDLPDIDITANGGIKLYKCTNTDIAALFSYLNSNSPGEAVLKMWQNPIQAVLACYYLPYPVTAKGSASITALGLDTGVTAYTAAPWQQWALGSIYVDYSCGNTFLDFEPYSSCSIYLPFIGMRKLNMDEVVGRNVGVTYQFDNTSGACVAYVTINGSVRYSFAGSCAVGIPLTQENWGQFYVSAATAAAGALAGGMGAAGSAIMEGASMAGIAAQGIAGAVKGGGGLSSLSAKPNISRSGSISGAASALAYPAPYLLIEYPDKAKVANPAPVTGLTCGRTLSLGSLSGYNVIEHVHLHGIAATASELEEIERLLYEGVVF